MLGAIALTVTPLSPSSLARALVNAWTDPLLVRYARSPRVWPSVSDEPVLTMRPQPASLMPGANALEKSSPASAFVVCTFGGESLALGRQDEGGDQRLESSRSSSTAASLQSIQEPEECVWRAVATGFAVQWLGAGERALFDGEVGMEVHLRGFDLFVSEPERDDGGVDVGVQEAHRRGVAIMENSP